MSLSDQQFSEQMQLFDTVPYYQPRLKLADGPDMREPFSVNTKPGEPAMQRDLPNAIPVTDMYGNNEGADKESRPNTMFWGAGDEARSYWVPTSDLMTVQEWIDPHKLNDRYRTGIDYGRKQEPEGQETEQDWDMPRVIRFSESDNHALLDGNHRVTLERHMGAMFHRVQEAGVNHGSRPDELDPSRGFFPEGKNTTSYDPDRKYQG